MERKIMKISNWKGDQRNESHIILSLTIVERYIQLHIYYYLLYLVT
jgi:hypothetical protein